MRSCDRGLHSSMLISRLQALGEARRRKACKPRSDLRPTHLPAGAHSKPREHPQPPISLCREAAQHNVPGQELYRVVYRVNRVLHGVQELTETLQEREGRTMGGYSLGLSGAARSQMQTWPSSPAEASRLELRGLKSRPRTAEVCLGMLVRGASSCPSWASGLISAPGSQAHTVPSASPPAMRPACGAAGLSGLGTAGSLVGSTCGS